jgi:hypothetical protein
MKTNLFQVRNPKGQGKHPCHSHGWSPGARRGKLPIATLFFLNVLSVLPGFVEPVVHIVPDSDVQLMIDHATAIIDPMAEDSWAEVCAPLMPTYRERIQHERQTPLTQRLPVPCRPHQLLGSFSTSQTKLVCNVWCQSLKHHHLCAAAKSAGGPN